MIEVSKLAIHMHTDVYCPSDLTLTIGMQIIKSAAVVQDLGIWLDSQLSLKQHINKVTSACFYQLRQIC